jgi:hypothetical protein
LNLEGLRGGRQKRKRDKTVQKKKKTIMRERGESKSGATK